MKNYKFIYDNKEYELGENNCSYFMNDEECPVEGIGKSEIIELLNQQEVIDFDVEYYDGPCESCHTEKPGNDKYFKFLEYHFYIFSKKGQYVISSISKEYEGASYSKLLKQGVVDNSYIVSVILCVQCGVYAIEIEQCDV